MRKFTALILSATSLLASCATAPSDPNPPTVVTVCPRLPDLEEVSPDALEPSFTKRMESFLSGSLPEPIDYGLHSNPAKPSTEELKKP